MWIISNAREIASEEMLKMLFLSNLTKLINTVEISIEQNPEVNEIAVLKENVKFAIFKLQKNLRILIVSTHQVRKLLKTNNSSTKIVKEHIR